MGYSLGVDLGTAYTAAAVSSGQHAEIIPLSDRSPQAPSVAFKASDGTFRYGEVADRHAVTEPDRVVREFKRRMGDRTPIFVAGTPMSAHALSKGLLGWVIDQVIGGQGEPPDQVVVTCPANWGPFRRELMSQVTALDVDFPISVCTEPEAAALHFASTRRVAEGRAVAVYDLGGGTFDAAVLRRTADGFEVLGAPAGLEQLGGADIDEAVFAAVTQGISWEQIDTEDPETLTQLARLRRDCTEAKEALSSETETTVSVAIDGTSSRVRLTRAELNELIAPLVNDTLDILERVIRRSGVPPEDLAAIVLVGGSSRVPLIGELIIQRFGRPAVLSAQPKLCVAMGAAMLGADLAAARAETEPAPTPPPATPDLGAAVEATSQPVELAGPTAAAEPPIPRSHADAAQHDAKATDRGPLIGTSVTDRGRSPNRVRPRVPIVRWISLGFAIIAVLLMIFGPAAAKTGPSWDDEFRVSAAGQPADATLTATIFGIDLTRPPVPVSSGTFDLRGSRLFLAGPTRGMITATPGAEPSEVVLYAAERWSINRWFSLPFGALVLTTLFALAYAESILRPIRRRRSRATAGELLGLIGSGLVLGVAAVLATWVVGDRLPDVSAALVIVVCVCACVGLLAFAWPPRQERARTSSSAVR